MKLSQRQLRKALYGAKGKRRQAVHKAIVAEMFAEDLREKNNPTPFGTRLAKGFADVLRESSYGDLSEALRAIKADEWEQNDLVMRTYYGIKKDGSRTY